MVPSLPNFLGYKSDIICSDDKFDFGQEGGVVDKGDTGGQDFLVEG